MTQRMIVTHFVVQSIGGARDLVRELQVTPVGCLLSALIPVVRGVHVQVPRLQLVAATRRSEMRRMGKLELSQLSPLLSRYQ